MDRDKVRRLRSESPEVVRVGSKKDTRRWCRGRVGIEHSYAWVRDERRNYGRERVPDNRAWWTETCSECGRQRGYCVSAFTDCGCGHHV